jgi:NSS family neurotransmitter:Na+ symporter
MEGINMYLTPDWSALGKASVWAAAYGQIFFTLSVGFGVMSAYASFRPKKTDITNSCFITGLSNSGVEFFAGFAVFSVIGFMATTIGVPVTGMEEAGYKIGGPGLAFVTYAKAIAMLPALQQLFGVLFFLMLFSLGIDSAFSLTEAASVAFADKFGFNRFRANILICVIGFFGGIFFTSGAGLYWLDIVDHWMNQYGLVVVSFIECVFLGWFFNIKWLSNEIDKYGEVKTRGWWIIMVKYVTPAILGFILITYLIQEIKTPYEGYEMKYLLIGGWGLTAFLLILSIVLSNLKGRAKAAEVKS